MTTPLPPDLQQFADRQIARGKYASLEEILLAGLQALAEREQVYQGRFEELRREVWLGVDAAERGELLDAATEIEAIRQRLSNSPTITRSLFPNMSRACRIIRLASRDIEAIADYLAAQSSLTSAERFLSGIDSTLQRIAQFPQIGRKRDELYPGSRSLLYA